MLRERRRLTGITMEDPVAIAIESDRASGGLDHVAEDREVPVGVFLLAEERGGDCAGRVINGGVEGETRATAFQPVMVAGIALHEQAGLRHRLTPATMPARPPGAGTRQAGSEEPAMDGPVRQVQSALLSQHLGEMLVIEARVGRLGPAEDPLPEGSGQAIVRRAAAVAMRQDGGAVAAEGGQQAASVAQREAEESSGL